MILEEATFADIMKELQKRFHTMLFLGAQEREHPHRSRDGTVCAASSGCGRVFRRVFGDPMMLVGLTDVEHVLARQHVIEELHVDEEAES